MPNNNGNSTTSTSVPGEAFPIFLAQEHEEKVYQALASILKRLQIPYVSEDNKLTTKGFFTALDKQIRTKDPNAKVYIAGGVVRSLLGYIYKKIYNEHQRHSVYSPENTDRVLNRIIRGASRKATSTQLDKELASLQALGIGSDLDILVEYSKENNESQKQQIMHNTTAFINSADIHLQFSKDQNTLKKSILPYGDVNEYHTQINSASAQGGSALDWLAFPITKESGCTMRMPEKYPFIMDQFFKGEIDYLPGEKTGSDKQTVRGLRPLLELPFLKMTENGQRQLLKELNELINRIKSGQSLSSGAQEQFKKMVRNARFEGAHNRFSRPENEDEIARLVHLISLSSMTGDKNMPLVPEFLRNEKIETRQLNKSAHEADAWLMKPAEFKEQWTHQGVLYHGTPQLEYVLTMIRNGLMPSIPEKQGTAVHGAGFYTSDSMNISKSYSAGNGTILELPLNPSDKLRVLSLLDFKTKYPKLYQSLEQEASLKKLDINQYLAEKYQLDIIVNSYPLIMNTAAVKVPKKAVNLIRAKLTLAGNTIQDIFSVLQNEIYSELSAFHQLGTMMGIADLPALPPIPKENVTKILERFPEHKRLDVILEVMNNNTEVRKEFLKLIYDNPNIVKEILLLIPEHQRLDIVKLKFLPDYSFLIHVASDPELLMSILTLIPPEQRFEAIKEKNYAGKTILHYAAATVEALTMVLNLYPKQKRIEALSERDNTGKNALYYAAQNKDNFIKILEQFPEHQRLDIIKLKYSPDVNGDSFLIHVASDPKWLISILALIPSEHRLDAIKEKDRFGKTILHYATSNIEALTIVLNLYPKQQRLEALKEKDDNAQNALHYAAQNIDALTMILLNYPESERLNALKEKNYYGETVLHMAAGNSATLTMTTINKQDKILHNTADNPASLKILSFLSESERLEAITTVNNEGDTVLHKAALSPGSLKVLMDFIPESQRLNTLIIENRSKEKVLHKATANSDSLKTLMDSIPNSMRFRAIFKTNNKGNTVAMEALSNPSSLKTLLASLPESQRTSVITMKYMGSILHEAVSNPESLKILLPLLASIPEPQRSEVVTRANNNGNTIFHVAASNPESLKILLAHIPKSQLLEVIPKANVAGNTLLHMIANEEILSTILSLFPESLRLGAMTKNNYGHTPLRLAKNPENFKALLAFLPVSQRLESLASLEMWEEHLLYPTNLKPILNLLPESQRIEVLIKEDMYGETPLHATIYPHYLSTILDVLPESDRLKAIIKTNKNGETVLHKTSRYHEALEAISLIPESQRLEVINTRDKEGNTLLHKAAVSNLRCLRCLKAVMAYIPPSQLLNSIFEVNKEGYTVLQAIANNQNPKGLIDFLQLLPNSLSLDILIQESKLISRFIDPHSFLTHIERKPQEQAFLKDPKSYLNLLGISKDLQQSIGSYMNLMKQDELKSKEYLSKTVFNMIYTKLILRESKLKPQENSFEENTSVPQQKEILKLCCTIREQLGFDPVSPTSKNKQQFFNQPRTGDNFEPDEKERPKL